MRSHAVPKTDAVLALDERDLVALAVRAVILRDLHQPQRRVLVLVAGLDEKNFLLAIRYHPELSLAPRSIGAVRARP